MSALQEQRLVARCVQYVLNSGGLAALRDWHPPQFARAANGSITGITFWDASTGVAQPTIGDLPTYSTSVQTTYERYLAYRIVYRDVTLRVCDFLYQKIDPSATLATRLDDYAAIIKTSTRQGFDYADAV